MSRPLRMRRRAFLVASGLAATGLQQTAAAQQSGNQSSDSAATETEPPATETDDESPSEPPAFDPEIDLGCYVVTVDAEAYDSVDLIFADATVARFAAGYSGTTTFGFSGDRQLDSDAETAISTFHGPIARVIVGAGGVTETATNSGPCVFEDLVFDCESAQHGQADDVRMEFVDGSSKRWDPPADAGQTRFGSPGRVIETISEESIDLTVENPTPNCAPGEYATVFDCIEVTVGPEEFATDPTFERIDLNFTDDTSQRFGQRGMGSGFTAPETFAGTDDNAGKIIDSVVIEKLDGDVVFRLVNPTAGECTQQTGFEPSVSVSQYSVTVDAPAYDRVVCQFGDGSTETFTGEFSGERQFGYVGVEELWDGPENRTFETFHGPIERCLVQQGDSQFETVVEADDPAVSGVQFSCSGVEFSGTTADSRLYYADGSFDWFQREQSGAVRFGAPGRLLDGIHLADQGLWLSNSTADCEPRPEQIEFDCRAVRLTEAEFGPASGAINRVQLVFTDGTDQVFGSRNPEAPAFETPAVFSGVDDHAGKVIASMACELPGRDAGFLRTNPNTRCEPAAPAGAGSEPDDGASTLDGEGYGSADVEALAESGAEAVSSSATVLAADTGEPLRAPPEAPSGPVEATGGSVAARQPAVETESTMIEGVPWWGWVAGLGGASGVLSHLVSRTVAESPGAAASGDANRGVDAATAGSDEPGPNDDEPAAGGDKSSDDGSDKDGEAGGSVDEEQHWWEMVDDK